MATTFALARSGRAGEVTIAIDPFDMAYPPFQGLAGLFPLYSWWTIETWSLTIFWLALAGLLIGATAWPEILGLSRLLRLPRWRGHGIARASSGKGHDAKEVCEN